MCPRKSPKKQSVGFEWNEAIQNMFNLPTCGACERGTTPCKKFKDNDQGKCLTCKHNPDCHENP